MGSPWLSCRAEWPSRVFSRLSQQKCIIMHLPPHPFFSTILDMDPTSGISLSPKGERDPSIKPHTQENKEKDRKKEHNSTLHEPGKAKDAHRRIPPSLLFSLASSPIIAISEKEKGRKISRGVPGNGTQNGPSEQQSLQCGHPKGTEKTRSVTPLEMV